MNHDRTMSFAKTLANRFRRFIGNDSKTYLTADGMHYGWIKFNHPPMPVPNYAINEDWDWLSVNKPQFSLVQLQQKSTTRNGFTGKYPGILYSGMIHQQNLLLALCVSSVWSNYAKKFFVLYYINYFECTQKWHHIMYFVNYSTVIASE